MSSACHNGDHEYLLPRLQYIYIYIYRSAVATVRQHIEAGRPPCYVRRFKSLGEEYKSFPFLIRIKRSNQVKKYIFLMQKPQSHPNFPFEVVVVTFPDEGASRVASGGPLQDLKVIYPKTEFLACCDPLGCRCGSGGGTLAALEQVESEVGDAQSKTILILHAGGDSSRCFTQMALGKAWTNLPLVNPTTGKEVLSNPIHVGMDSIARIFSQSHSLPKGSVVIAASDALLSIPRYKGGAEEESVELGASEHGSSDGNGPIFPDVLGVTFPTPWETAKNHGVYVLAQIEERAESQREARALEVPIRKVLQKPSLETLQSNPFVTFSSAQKKDGHAWIDNGIIAFLPRAAEALFELAQGVLHTTTESGLLRSFEERHASEPELTYQDVTYKVDLYTHFLQALTISGEPGQQRSIEQRRETYLQDHASDLDKEVATGIFDALSRFQFMSLAIPAGKFLHLGTTRELIDFYVHGCRGSTSMIQKEKRSTADKFNRQDLYTQNCSYFGHELGMTRRMDILASWEDDNRNSTNQKLLAHTCIEKDCVLMGSILEGTSSSQIEEGTVVEFCSLEKNPQHGSLCINIGKNCLVSGLRQSASLSAKVLRIPNDTCVQMMPLVADNNTRSEPSFVMMALGVNDPIKKTLPDSKLFGINMEAVLKWTGLSPEEVWDPSSSRTIWNAKLHPVVKKDSEVSFVQLWDWLNELRKNNGTDKTENAKASLDCWKRHKKLSLCQVRDFSDAAAEFRYRHDLVHKIIPARHREYCSKISTILKERKHNECDFYPLLVDTLSTKTGDTGGSFVGSCATQALHTLDEVVAASLLEQHQYDVCGRTLMVASALLDGLANTFFRGTDVLLRDNESSALLTEIRDRCSPLLQDLESPSSSGADRQKIYFTIVNIREECLRMHIGSPEHLNLILSEFSDIMETIARIMTEICVAGFLTDNTAIGIKATRKEAINEQWVVATAPARVDLAGGWSDTPPVCYEYGSAVTGMAVTVDGKKPLSCRVRIIPCDESSKALSDNGIIFMRSELRHSKSCELLSALDIKLHTLSDLRDARNPAASCALIKCALLCLGLVSLEALQHDQSESDTNNLQNLVNDFCRSKAGTNVRMEVVVTSLLPQGSGMGTSSILGGCVLAAVGHCIGVEHSLEFDSDSGDAADIIDSVSALEQILSTGGGFQDQVNGLIGGFKTVSSKANRLPIRLNIERRTVDSSFQKELNGSLMLAFTGKTRLAKNILQNVLRRWARRTPEVVATVQNLVAGAQTAKEALHNCDLKGLGECLGNYYELKKNMAGKDSGVEPDLVAGILENLHEEKLLHGASLCGAGGGGFMVMVASGEAKKSRIHAVVAEYLADSKDADASSFSWHECTVCEDGLTTKVLPATEVVVSATDFYDSWHH